MADIVNIVIEEVTTDVNIVVEEVITEIHITVSEVAAGGAWGDITGTLSDQTDLQAALDGKADALGADDNYVTDAEKVVIGNTSGTNTGDQDLSGYATKVYVDATFAGVSHTHAFTDITGKPTTLSGYGITDGQATLVSGTNIKTINGTSLLGSGDIVISTTDASKLPLAGGTMVGNLLFTDNTYDIGASGATRPRTGYFGTSVFTPLIVGGTSTTQSLIYKTTIGIGATGADHIFQVGNNGGTEAMRILNNGYVGINTTTPQFGTLEIKQKTDNAAGGVAVFSADGTTRAGRFWVSNSGIMYLESGGTGAGDIVMNTGAGRIILGSGTGSGKLSIPVAPTAIASYGLISVGSGAWDGITSGFFNGSSNGTLIAGNLASGSNADLLNLQVGGSLKVRATKDGNMTFGGSMTTITDITCGSNYTFGISGRTYLASASAGVLLLSNWSNTGFDRVQFGGTTSSFPSLKRTTTSIEARLADDSGFATFQSLYNRFGSGSPESVITAPIGAIYHRTDGGAGTSVYVKESGTGNTGWVAK